MQNKGRLKNKIWHGIYRKALLLIVAGALLFAIAFFGFHEWLSYRVGPEYYGKPETLLPPETALMATWSNFSSFLGRLQELKAMEQIRQDEGLATLLLADPTWRKLEKDKDKTHYKILSTMASDFVDKWMGRELTFAIIPSPESLTSDTLTTATPHSAMLIIARTNFGFEHNLAELVAQFYPELALEKRNYRGQGLYRYNAHKTRRAFAYCRFGNTVVMSLRSAEWRYLEKIVDYKIDAGGRKKILTPLAASPAFLDASKRFVVGDGLNAYVSPHDLELAMHSLPSASADSGGWRFWIDYAGEKLQGVRWGVIGLNLAQGLRLDSFWKYATPHKPSMTSSNSASLYANIPANPGAVLIADSPGLRESLLDLRGRMKESKAYRKDLSKFEKKWAKQTGSHLAQDWLEPMGNNLGIVVNGFTNGLLFPMPVGGAWWSFSPPEGANRLEQVLMARAGGGSSFFLPFGQLNFQTQGDQLRLDLNGSLSQSADPKENGKGNEHSLLAELQRAPQQPAVSLFVNFQIAYGHLDRMYRSASFWSNKVRKNVQKWTTILGVLQYMDALRLTAVPMEDGVKVELIIPVR